MKNLLRSFPKTPGSAVWICQNVSRGTEHEVDTEQATCDCLAFEHKRRCRHVDYTLSRARLYAGARDEYERLVAGLLKEAA